MNKKLVLTGILLIAGILLAACGGSAPAETQAPEATAGSGASENTNDTAATEAPVAVPGVDVMLDPANQTSDAVAYVYEGLVKEQDGAITGVLADSYTVSEDGLDYIFTLRSNVSFHDGSPLTVDAVIANLNRWFDPADANRGSGEYAAWAANFGGFKGELTEDGKPKSWVDGFEKGDGLNILIHLNAVDPELPKKLTDPAFVIVNPAAFAGGDGGTGAYFVAANDGSNLTLEPFAGYWDAAAIPTESMEVPVP